MSTRMLLMSFCCLCFYHGTSQSWSLAGNAGTTPGTEFLGTTDGNRLVIKTNGTERMTVLSNGNVGIGVTNPTLLLSVNGNTLISGNITSPGSGTGSEKFGESASVGSNTYSFAAGNYAVTTGNESVALGYFSKAGYHSVAIGSSAQATGFASTIIGVGGSDNGTNYLTSVGASITSPGYFSGGSYLNGGIVNIGYNNSAAGYSHTYLLGANLTIDRANQMLVGNGLAGGFILDMVLGGGLSNELAASYGPLVIRTTDGVNSNSAGMPLVFKGGKSTGSASGGYLAFYTTPAGSSGTSVNIEVERMRIAANGSILIGGSAGTSGQVLTSAGPNAAPTWSTVTGTAWGLTGNAGTDPATNFIGTTDDKDIVFKRNGTKSGVLSGNNTAFGVAALQSNTSGINNTVVGVAAGQANTTGIHNSFVGQAAGYSTTTGMQNSFFGSMAGYSNTDGSFNCFFGLSSGFANTSGWGNAFMGASAGAVNTTGVMNSFIGYGTGGSNTTGAQNCFFGAQSGLYNTTGTYNNFMGFQAGLKNTTGGANNFMGSFAGLNNTTGAGNSYLGYFAGYNSTTGSYNTFLGQESGEEVNTGAYNTFVGSSAGRGITTGNYNTIIGANVTGLATGLSNTIILADGQGNQRILVDNNGKVGIGNTAPTEKLDVTGNIYTTGKILINQANNSSVTPYALAVNGSAIFTKAVVKLNANWPDYVFNGSYSLLPLPELETYIRMHKHLPGIPSATDVEKNGIDLGDNQSALLKKIEELTLYVIELNKKVDLVSKENEQLKKNSTVVK